MAKKGSINMRIILSGASGHMGRAVAEQAKAEGIEVLFGVDAAGGTNFAEITNPNASR